MFRSEASERHGGGGGADHRSLLMSASSEQTAARVFICARRTKFFGPNFKIFNIWIIYLDALQNFPKLTALVVTTKFDLCFRCDLYALRCFAYMGLTYCFIGSELF